MAAEATDDAGCFEVNNIDRFRDGKNEEGITGRGLPQRPCDALQFEFLKKRVETYEKIETWRCIHL